MLMENLPRAKQLEEDINECKENIERWEHARGLKDRHVSILTAISKHNSAYLEGIPFNVLKVCALDFYTKQLSELEMEFSNLN